MRVAILTNILAPYRIKLFEEIAARVSDLTVVLMSGGHDDRHWVLPEGNFKTVLLRGASVRGPGMGEPIHFNWDALAVLRRIDPDIVVSGGFALANLCAFAYCKLFGRRYVGWAELTLRDSAERSLPRRLIRRMLISGSDASIASSSAAVQAFTAYGAKPGSVLLSVMPIDVRRFRDGASEFRASSRFDRLRAQYSTPCLIGIGRLLDLKGHLELFAIYERILREHADATLLVAGEGRDREKYRELIERRGWKKVHLLGHLQEQDLIEHLAIADLFVFPTPGDAFGAVVSEALAAGVPTVSSIHAAATYDLIEHGRTGFRIDPADIEASAEITLQALRLGDEKRRTMIDSGYEKVRPHDFPEAAAGIVFHLKSFINPSHI